MHTSDTDPDDVQSTLAEIRELRQRLAALEARLDPGQDETEEPVASRRHMLRLAGATAAGAVAAAVVGPRLAAADLGITLNANIQTSVVPVRSNYTGNAANASGFVFQGGSSNSNNVDTLSTAALAGWAWTDGNVRDGVFGRSAMTGGNGLYGYAGGGSGVSGSGQVGGTFAGSIASLQLVTGTNLNPNSQQLVSGFLGMIQADQAGNVWLCVTGGIPGVWRQIGGPGFAGAYHAVSPGRVYDSRLPAPTPGPLASGATRTVSVADRRALTDGSVAQADFVPAGATSITCNVTVVNTVGSGFLTVNPGGNTTVGSASANWSGSNQILNNGVSLTLNGSRQVTVIAGGGGTTDFILDVTGYYL